MKAHPDLHDCLRTRHRAHDNTCFNGTTSSKMFEIDLNDDGQRGKRLDWLVTLSARWYARNARLNAAVRAPCESYGHEHVARCVVIVHERQRRAVELQI